MNNFTDIKLVITDMDGTLLDSRGDIPQDFFPILKKLSGHGIHTAIASGRSWPMLHGQFPGQTDLLTFICENGQCIVDHGQAIDLNAFDPPLLQEAAAAVCSVSGIHPLFSGFNQAWIPDSASPDLRSYWDSYYENLTYFSSLEDIDEPICKITIYDPLGAEENSWQKLKYLRPAYNITVDGPCWLNISRPGGGKGRGVQILQKHFQVLPEQTLIFGDYLNDMDMMDKGYYSCAMANAHPDIKAAARFQVPSNDEKGVIQILRRLLAEKEKL